MEPLEEDDAVGMDEALCLKELNPSSHGAVTLFYEGPLLNSGWMGSIMYVIVVVVVIVVVIVVVVVVVFVFRLRHVRVTQETD